MKLQCKCHGVSGACNMRTCWLAIQEFRLVATSLRRRYDGATRVQVAQEDASRLVVANRNHRKPTRSHLIYLEQSPDFCNFDPHTGQSLDCLSIRLFICLFGVLLARLEKTRFF